MSSAHPSNGSFFGEPRPNAVGRAALVPHSGCVRELDAASSERLLWYGEDLIRVKLPTRLPGGLSQADHSGPARP